MKNKTQIKFGTDGWRALIARDFTFETVAKTAQAVSAVMQESLPDRKKMLVGYDRRFLSREFAETAAVVYANNGFDVLMSETYFPTPVLSWCAKNMEGACGATVITASHNPPEWNGFKFKEIFGGSALPATTARFEEKANAMADTDFTVPSAHDFETCVKKHKIKIFNPMKDYFAALRKLVDVNLIRTAAPKVALDVMHGSASKHFSEFLSSIGVDVTELHGEANPGFRGVAPEPIGKNLPELQKLVAQENFDCGLATDGDSDRLGAVDENGEPFTTQQILSVVYWHMLKNRGKKWSIARSVSTTRMVDLIAKSNGFDCIETPVGFKFIAERMVGGDAQIGGEESGGVGFIDHIPERDGILTGLMLLELIAKTGKGLSAVYDDLCREERPYHFIRLDLHIDQSTMSNAMGRLQDSPPTQWGGREVDELVRKDGFKFYLKDGSWILIRPSGTEPIFRLYAEAESTEASQELIESAKQFVCE